MFAIIKNQPIKLQMVVFAVKYETPYGGIPDSEQLRRDTIWGYPEYGASNCVRHMVSPGLDDFNCETIMISAISLLAV